MLNLTSWRWLAACATLFLASCGSEEAPFVQPHVIFITAGDLALEDISLYGGPIDTPNIERIAQRGIVFTQGYAAAAQAGPARAALISGQYPQRFGFMYDTGGVRMTIRDASGIPDTVTMVQDRLRAIGYETALFGSWNIGAKTDFYATRRGFDYFWGTLGASTAYIAPRDKSAVFAVTPNHRLPPSRSRFDTVFSGETAEAVYNNKTYLTDDMGSELVKYVNRFAKANAPAEGDATTSQSLTPLFLWAAFHAPREPLTALKSDFEGLPDLGSEQRNTYGAMVRALDRNVGRLLDALDANGLADNAIIVFTADRGCNALAGTCPCGQMRGGAPSFTQAALRVPMVVAFPGGEKAGTTTDVPVMSFDITATVMDYADPEDRLVPEFDGRSLREVLDGQLRRFEQRALFWQQTPLIAMVMDGKKLLLDGQDNQAKLYDLSVDPGEANDISGPNSYIVSDMETRLDVWQQANSFPSWEGSTYRAATVCEQQEMVLVPPR